MGAKELNTKLLKEFPQLKKSFEKLTNWQEGIQTGSFVVFEDLFFKYVHRYLKNESISEKNFQFINSLLNSGDDYAIDVVTIAIIENLVSTTSPKLYAKYLNENMKKIANKIGKNSFYNWKELD